MCAPRSSHHKTGAQGCAVVPASVCIAVDVDGPAESPRTVTAARLLSWTYLYASFISTHLPVYFYSIDSMFDWTHPHGDKSRCHQS